MRHFYVRAMKAIEIKEPSEIVDKNLEKAVSIAEKIAPFKAQNGELEGVVSR
jgi:hypothetical protein